ncbi:MAG: 3-phosphoshikimate 1-carboxyvinyltransferase [Chloroflexota bacterium]|nr:3-phosphoshikimate 1-carboxyvinyltransferase [Chloroflexota bacterium]
MRLAVRGVPRVAGEIMVPGDKSITHRALFLSSLAEGDSKITGYLDGADCRATMDCLRQLGVPIAKEGEEALVVHGKGLRGWQEPEAVLNCVRSGTTMRLMAGLLAGQDFYSVLSGESQLRRRPMDRVTHPLQKMGARIWGRQSGRLPPLSILGSPLRGIEYALPMASAQVKSCVLLAGLYAEGATAVVEPGPSRDHTERMLRARGVELTTEGLRHELLQAPSRIEPMDVSVPGDFSSAAYFLVSALLASEGDVLIRGVGTNPTRTGLLDVLKKMGADVEIVNPRTEGGEPVGDLQARPQELRAVEVGGAMVPRMIDEFPLLALAATQAQGVTRVREAKELRVKETDRIATTVEAMRAMGAQIEERPDGFDVEGPTPLRAAVVDSHGDHRLAMTLAIAGLLTPGETYIEGGECIADSFPGFVERLNALTGGAIA